MHKDVSEILLMPEEGELYGSVHVPIQLMHKYVNAILLMSEEGKLYCSVHVPTHQMIIDDSKSREGKLKQTNDAKTLMHKDVNAILLM